MAIWDTLMGNSAADASNAAAADTYRKQQAATAGMRTAGDDYAGEMRTLAGGYDPYVKAGGSALEQLMFGLGLGGPGGTERFTAGYRSLPGYQSGLETGTNAALRGVNASGMSNSGRALKALQRFGSDYEDQRVGDYLAQLMGLSDRGMSATGARTGVIGQGLQGRFGAYTGAYGADYDSAGTIGEGMVAGEQAKSDAMGRLINAGAYVAGSVIPKLPGFPQQTAQPSGSRLNLPVPRW
jgi:hypothetical protein